MKNKFSKKDFIYEFTRNQAGFNEIHSNILEGMDVHGSNFIVLMCAIFIASIGLNMNSTAVIIGAMLISPLMGSITGIGYGVGTYNVYLLKDAFRILVLAVAVSILTSTLYFSLTPITVPGSEILARTSPTIWDVMIAFFGGIVGMIGVTRKKASNVIPGVAIATALMPPLCTVGYGLAHLKSDIFWGASYLFFINCFFISVATFLVTKMLRIPVWTNVEKVHQKRVKYSLTILAIVVMIPSLFSAFQMIQDSINVGHLNAFAKYELRNHYVLDSMIDERHHKVTFVVLGEEIKEVELESLSQKLSQYGFDEMKLEIKQNEENVLTLENYLSLIEAYKNEIINHNSHHEEQVSALSEIKPPTLPNAKALKNELQAMFGTIDTAYFGMISATEEETASIPVLLIYSSDESLKEHVATIKAWLNVRLEVDMAEVIIETSSSD